MSTNGTKKGRPRRELRDEIISVAEQAFFSNGIRAVSLEDLVREISTSKSAFYRYFDDKSALVSAVMDRLNQRMNSNLAEIVDGDLGFSEKLVAIVRYTSALLNRVNDKFFLDLQSATPKVWEQYLRARQERVETIYYRLFRRGQEQGQLRHDVPAPVLTLIYLHMTEMVIDPEAIAEFRKHEVDPYEVIQTVFFRGTQARPIQQSPRR